MEIPSRNLALELVRVTETAAIAASKWIGRGAKNDADHAAVEAMRRMISTVQMRGTVVIGEGEKDDAPMLYNGEAVGDGTGPECDVAVDPIDGTTLTAKGANNAISVIALASRGSMLNISDAFYMLKLAVGPEAAGVIDISESITENLKRIAKAKHKSVDELTVVMIDRPRHDKFAEEIRAAGARTRHRSASADTCRTGADVQRSGIPRTPCRRGNRRRCPPAHQRMATQCLKSAPPSSSPTTAKNCVSTGLPAARAAAASSTTNTCATRARA